MDTDDTGERPPGSNMAGEGELVADRYRLLEEIGRGGVARVYRARDERTDRIVALKRLQYEGSRLALLTSAFEHEFQVLDQLAHPRVVRVFDFGTSGDVPYYTMQLLEGGAMNKRLPMPLERLWQVLRDTASCLALLHARRYVHRDVTTRNIWCGDDGRATLLDFGTMVPVGHGAETMGTPPFVAPEALDRLPLDGRTDLYALGVVAYRAITGKYPYRAGDLENLPRLWRRAPPPTLLGHRGVPDAVAELIMALLSLDRQGRPGSATEVLERLCGATGIELDADDGTARSYLLTPPLVQREAPLEQLREAITDACQGQGSALQMHGPAGIGCSRLLQELAREASVHGAITLSVGATTMERGELSLMAGLCEQAVARLPRDVLQLAARDVDALSELAPGLPAALGLTGKAAQDRPARHRRVAALHDWLLAATELVPLVIAVDDVQHCSTLAQGLLSGLARAASGRRLLLVCAHDDEMSTPGTGGFSDALGEHCQEIRLEALDRQAVATLTEALFGDAEHLGAVASWLHRVSRGLPGTCIALAQHLLDSGLAHYEAGHWHLPAYPQEHGLPDTVSALMRRRIEQLSADALDLAQALALVYDDTRPDHQPASSLTVGEQARLLGRDHRAVHRAMAELEEGGIVRRVGDRDVIAHRAMAEFLRTQLDSGRRRALHRTLGTVLLERPDERLAAIRHTQLAGDQAEAVELLCDRTVQLQPADLVNLRLSVTTECYAEALDFARTARLPRKTVSRLASTLQYAVSVFDWSLAGRIHEELERLVIESGLEHWDELAESSDDGAEIMSRCMERAAEHHDPDDDQTLSPAAAMRRVPATAGVLTTTSSRAQDRDELIRIRNTLLRMRQGTDRVELAEQASKLSLELLEGRRLSVDPSQLANAYLREPTLGGYLRLAGFGVTAHMAGVLAAARGSEDAQAVATLLESGRAGLWLGAHLHWLCHGFRCEGEPMREWEQRAMTVAPDDLWRRRAFMMYEARLHTLIRNGSGLKTLLRSLEWLAGRFPGWRPWLEWTRGEHLMLQGSFGDARAAFRSATCAAPAGEHAAWGYAHASLVRAQTRGGDHGSAIAAARAGITSCEQLGLDPMVRLEHLLALAEAQCASGDHGRASATLDAAEAQRADAGFEGVFAGRVHELYTELALGRGEADAAQASLTALAPLYLDSGIPGLAARHVQLADRLARRAPGHQRPTSKATIELRGRARPAAQVAPQQESPGRRPTEIADPVAQARRALEHLVAESAAAGGLLYLQGAGALRLAAKLGELPPSADTRAEAERALANAELERSTGDDVTSDVSVASSPSRSLRALPLRRDGQALGVVVLSWQAGSTARRPRKLDALADVIAQTLGARSDAGSA